MLASINDWFLALGAEYGVNPYIFGGIYVGAVPFFLLDRDNALGKLSKMCPAFTHHSKQTCALDRKGPGRHGLWQGNHVLQRPRRASLDADPAHQRRRGRDRRAQAGALSTRCLRRRARRRIPGGARI